MFILFLLIPNCVLQLKPEYCFDEHITCSNVFTCYVLITTKVFLLKFATNSSQIVNFAVRLNPFVLL